MVTFVYYYRVADSSRFPSARHIGAKSFNIAPPPPHPRHNEFSNMTNLYGFPFRNEKSAAAVAVAYGFLPYARPEIIASVHHHTRVAHGLCQLKALSVHFTVSWRTTIAFNERTTLSPAIPKRIHDYCLFMIKYIYIYLCMRIKRARKKI